MDASKTSFRGVEATDHEIKSSRSLALPSTPDGKVLYPYTVSGIQAFTEDFSFIFYAAGPDNRIKYANRAWYEFAERNAPAGASYDVGIGTPLIYSETSEEALTMLHLCEEVREGSQPYWEDIVPCHSNNQPRWMLYRIQRLGQDLIFTCFFLRFHDMDPPRNHKIRCLITKGDRDDKWIPSDKPIHENDSLALGPECSLQLYADMQIDTA